MKDFVYPYSKCLNPRQIINPYTKEKLVVGCGKCEACLARKSASQALKCRLESAVHRFSYFITLTFNDYYIPRATAVKTDKGYDLIDYYESYQIYDRVSYGTGEVLASVDTSDLDMFALARKVNCRGYFPYLSKRELQLFLKRLRKAIKYEKIRFYAVGEYGPVHYRPHFHILLWFDDPRTAACLEYLVRSCWQFGFIHCERVKDDCSRYVAGYLNGSCYLPKIYQSRKLKPFAVHSFFLGEKFLSDSIEKVYETPARDFVQRSCFIAGTYSEFNLWRSYKSYFFPKCPRFSELSSDVRFQSYRSFLMARTFAHTSSCYKQAQVIVNYLYGSNCTPYHLHDDPKFNVFLRQLCYMCRLDPWKEIDTVSKDLGLTPDKDYMSALRSVYMYLKVSKHFLNFCCQGNYNQEKTREVLFKIENFYKDCDYNGLVDFYKDLEQVTDFNFNDTSELFLLYDNLDYNDRLRKLKQTILYKRYRSQVINRFRDKIKHKALNDKNLLFHNK